MSKTYYWFYANKIKVNSRMYSHVLNWTYVENSQRLMKDVLYCDNQFHTAVQCSHQVFPVVLWKRERTTILKSLCLRVH